MLRGRPPCAPAPLTWLPVRCTSGMSPTAGAKGGAMAKRLEGRVVIVTGGGHGIGEVYCRALAGEGARVVVAEIDGKAADATAAALCAEGAEALAVVTNVADET